MQTALRLFLAIFLGHLLTDFVFQTRRMVERKKRGRPLAYFVHGIIHYVSVAVVLGFFVEGSFVSARTQFAIIGLSLAHVLIDIAKVQFTRTRFVEDGALPYVLDQALHFLTIVAATFLVAPAGASACLAAMMESARSARTEIIAVPAVYIAVVFGGGYLIRFLTRSLAENAERSFDKAADHHLQNAGLYIGWLERFLVMTALLLQSPAMVGFIFAAKSIARYPELKTERFAEYFLIGTLLSLCVALLGGALLLRLVFHKVLLSG